MINDYDKIFWDFDTDTKIMELTFRKGSAVVETKTIIGDRALEVFDKDSGASTSTRKDMK